MDEKTFWESTKPMGDCLIWMRGTGNKGKYGYCLFEGREGTAHRAAFRIRTGKWPEGVLHHTCENTLCVNPDHLRHVTPKEHAFIHFGSKTHCPEGHPYSGDNLRVYKGERFCRECMRKRQREYQRRIYVPHPRPELTHCKKGHELAGDNLRLYTRKSGGVVKYCRSCERERVATRRDLK